MAEWDRDITYLREDIQQVRDAVVRLESTLQTLAGSYVSQGQWATWKNEVWDPYQHSTTRVLKDIERRTSLWLGMLTGAIVTGLVALIARLIA
jgi:hypothetical protein